jgi:hypothetical protein
MRLVSATLRRLQEEPVVLGRCTESCDTESRVDRTVILTPGKVTRLILDTQNIPSLISVPVREEAKNIRSRDTR